MIIEFDNLADIVREGAIPAWLNQQIEERKAEIQQALVEGREVVLRGPHAEEFRVQPRKKKIAAAA